MPSPQTELPDCYQGSPIEMVQQMAQQMKPGLGTDEAIDLLTEVLANYRGVHIEIDEGPEELRATGFVVALLLCGLARPMAEG